MSDRHGNNLADSDRAAKRARRDDLPGVHLTNNEFRVVKIQFLKDKPNFPFLHKLREEYCKFLRIKLSNLDKAFAPPYWIDKLWHAHILSTKEYHAFCWRAGTHYLHHDPTLKQGKERYEWTMQVYKEHFGEPDKMFWPDDVEDKALPAAFEDGASRG